MKFVLIALILVLAAGSYYEFQQQRTASSGFRQEFKDLQTRFNAAQARSQTLQAGRTDSAQALKQAKTEAADLGQQVQAAQKEVDDKRKSAAATAAAATPAPNANAPPPGQPAAPPPSG